MYTHVKEDGRGAVWALVGGCWIRPVGLQSRTSGTSRCVAITWTSFNVFSICTASVYFDSRTNNAAVGKYRPGEWFTLSDWSICSNYNPKAKHVYYRLRPINLELLVSVRSDTFKLRGLYFTTRPFLCRSKVYRQGSGSTTAHLRYRLRSEGDQLVHPNSITSDASSPCPIVAPPNRAGFDDTIQLQHLLCR